MSQSGDQLLYASGRTRVLRVLRPDRPAAIRKEAVGPSALFRMRREAEVSRRLADVPGVPRLLEVSVDGAWLLLEDCAGTSLADLVGEFDPRRLVRFAGSLAEVLAAVHRAGVIHKDLNPANVLVRPDGEPMLIDFDLATTSAEERPDFTHHRQIAGTLEYLAPEQTGRTGRPVDQRADLYALGATLYELAGGPPFQTDGDPLALVHAHLARLPAPPHEVNPAVSVTLSAIVMRLLEKEPDQRRSFRSRPRAAGRLPAPDAARARLHLELARRLSAPGPEASEPAGPGLPGLAGEQYLRAIDEVTDPGRGAPGRRTPARRGRRLIHMDGTERWVEATVTDLGHDPAVRGVMLHLRDITERHRLETELRHAQKLESIGQLSAGIAHEINTPIQFIGDNVRFLTDAFSELAEALRPAAAQGPGLDLKDLLDEIPHALTDMREGTNRVATIVQAMQALGQPGVSEKEDADLNEAIRNTLVVAANEIRPVADVVTDLADLPPVRCIPGDITQVLLNLLVNAAQAMAEKLAAGAGRGTLTVRTRRNCGSADGGTREDAVIEAQDTGSGIPPAIADRVFDQFFTTKEVGAGTGQGLAVAHTLIHDHHGGTISFTSTPGEGTTFTVRLPIRPPGRPT